MPAAPAAWATRVRIDAVVHHDGQTFLTWTSSNGPGTTYWLYRSDLPISNSSDLAAATLVGYVGDSTWCDRRLSALTGTLYSYAVDSLASPLTPGQGLFIHPVSDPAVIAGNGTIGLEILDDLPEVDAIVIPYGGGGLSTGIASAVRALRPVTRLYACEVETAAPLAASLAAGEPQRIDYRRSFVDGIGGPFVLEDMWPLVRRLLDGSLVVSIAEVAAAVRTLVERARVVAEGAGAAPVAAALAGRAGAGRIACVVSGGNLDAAKLAVILGGGVPE